jgi:hypothetical protein
MPITRDAWQSVVLEAVAGTQWRVVVASLSSGDRIGTARLTHPSIANQLTIGVSLARFPSSVLRRIEIRRQLHLPT